MRLVSINVERSNHLDTVLPFLKRVDPDVVCVQELHESDTGLFEHVLGKCAVYAPNCLHIADVDGVGPQIMGTALFTKRTHIALRTHYYAGSRKSALELPAKEYVEDHALIGCDLVCDGDVFRVMTTHFTWSPRGEATDIQRGNMNKLLKVLAGQGEFVFTGDFNAPRGGEIFAELSSRYKDNVPLHYETSIDVNLHRAGRAGRGHEVADKMVDGLFTTNRFVASNVELVFGVSDHAAIVAEISSR